jgi:hypothetical protein
MEQAGTVGRGSGADPAGLLATPIPAHALPAVPLAPANCQQWGFAGPTQIVATGRTIVTFNGDGQNVNTSATANALTVPINGFVDANKFMTLSVSMPDPHLPPRPMPALSVTTESRGAESPTRHR